MSSLIVLFGTMKINVQLIVFSFILFSFNSLFIEVFRSVFKIHFIGQSMTKKRNDLFFLFFFLCVLSPLKQLALDWFLFAWIFISIEYVGFIERPDEPKFQLFVLTKPFPLKLNYFLFLRSAFGNERCLFTIRMHFDSKFRLTDLSQSFLCSNSFFY